MVKETFSRKEIMITLGVQLSRIRTERAAVIPYVIERRKIYYLLGRDKRSGELTDFGGGVTQEETALLGALREFREESDEIFGGVYDDINETSVNIALRGEKQSTLFVPLDREWLRKAPHKFFVRDRANKKRSHDELSEILWVSEEEFQELILDEDKRMWEKLRKFYRSSYTRELVRALRMAYQ